MRCGERIKLFTSSVMWAVWTEEELHETKVQFRPLAYHIFHNTDLRRVRFVSVNGQALSKALEKKILKPLENKFLEKILENEFEKKIGEKKNLKKNFRKKILEK